jgi:hypothetical protein
MHEQDVPGDVHKPRRYQRQQQLPCRMLVRSSKSNPVCRCPVPHPKTQDADISPLLLLQPVHCRASVSQPPDVLTALVCRFVVRFLKPLRPWVTRLQNESEFEALPETFVSRRDHHHHHNHNHHYTHHDGPTPSSPPTHLSRRLVRSTWCNRPDRWLSSSPGADHAHPAAGVALVGLLQHGAAPRPHDAGGLQRAHTTGNNGGYPLMMHLK